MNAGRIQENKLGLGLVGNSQNAVAGGLGLFLLGLWLATDGLKVAAGGALEEEDWGSDPVDEPVASCPYAGDEQTPEEQEHAWFFSA